jgi:2-polyprenyl-3-methyl-5-hydroxy-6-metoxy-1,4-benzoquinol methylase
MPVPCLPSPQARRHQSWPRRFAGWLAQSLIMRSGKSLWEQNERDWNLNLSKWQKLSAGGYLILADYARGAFPPTFDNQEQAHLNEINYAFSLPGVTEVEATINALRKPFWFSTSNLSAYLNGFVKLVRALELAQMSPPAKLLELGGGGGWTAQFLAEMGFRVVSTTISEHEVKLASSRAAALAAKGIPFELRFLAAPMESVGSRVSDECPFDVVFVFEALHHAFDWKAAIQSAFACLRPGGWLLLCNEPNVLHTAISYRVAKLSSTHEIGFSRSELINHLKTSGFTSVTSIGPRPHWFLRAHWLMAQRPPQ